MIYHHPGRCKANHKDHPNQAFTQYRTSQKSRVEMSPHAQRARVIRAKQSHHSGSHPASTPGPCTLRTGAFLMYFLLTTLPYPTQAWQIAPEDRAGVGWRQSPRRRRCARAAPASSPCASRASASPASFSSRSSSPATSKQHMPTSKHHTCYHCFNTSAHHAPQFRLILQLCSLQRPRAQKARLSSTKAFSSVP